MQYLQNGLCADGAMVLTMGICSRASHATPPEVRHVERAPALPTRSQVTPRDLKLLRHTKGAENRRFSEALIGCYSRHAGVTEDVCE